MNLEFGYKVISASRRVYVSLPCGQADCLGMYFRSIWGIFTLSIQKIESQALADKAMSAATPPDHSAHLASPQLGLMRTLDAV